jgi:hypothetical protein
MALRRFLRRMESALWQDLHPLHSGYFVTVVACLGLVALGLLALAVWAFFAP